MDDISLIDMMLPAFVEVVVLSGMLTYLGLHVIRRQIIFVDLALAQIAAMGATVGFLLGMAPGSIGTWVFSLLFTAIGAAIFSISRFDDERVPQEAVIGLIYAVAAAVVILIVSKAPHGAEHIEAMLIGAIIWVKWPTIVGTALAYAVVGGIHMAVGRRFIHISEDPTGQHAENMRVRLWDFLFYLTFGIVISIAVATAGVVLVFVLLVVPAIIAIMLTTRFSHQLYLGWVVGTVVSMAGLVGSYYFDLPAGPSVAVAQGGALALVGMVLTVVGAAHRGRALGRLSLGLGLAAVALVGLFALGRVLADSPLAISRSEAEQLHLDRVRAGGQE